MVPHAFLYRTPAAAVKHKNALINDLLCHAAAPWKSLRKGKERGKGLPVEGPIEKQMVGFS
jgi:hypothetical protein